MGRDVISTPDFSTPQAPSKHPLSPKISVIVIIFILSILLLLLYFIFPSKTPLSPFVSTELINEVGPTLTPTPVPLVTLGLVGDLGLGRHITSISRSKNDFSWPFLQISPWLLSHDLNLANLESPIITDCPEGKTGTFTFCGDTRFLPYLKSNKLVFNLVNNHILNYGSKGLSETKNYLSKNTIDYFPEFTIKTINGIKLGFLGYDFITNPSLDPNLLIADVQKYDPLVDWLIVSLHWGNEYLPKPEAWRVSLAHQLVDAGADIIHGHHPHVWQDYEIYQDKIIFYSFGNFIFDQSWSYETSHSQIGELILSKNKIESLKLYPIEIRFNSQPALSP